jgi:pimeloyl-ACP methyl ester carboxylesterase
LFILSFALAPTTLASAQPSTGVKPTIVLVHGAWADGSSWNKVSSRLQSLGYTVDVPPNTLRGVSDDASYLASYLATISGPIVLVGHSYGGFVISNAATGNANVKALVYVDAFIPAQGESLLSLTSSSSCLGGNPTDIFNIVPFSGGADVYIKTAPNSSFVGFDNCFANGVPAKKAGVLAADHRPLSAAVLGEPSGPPAWASIPSWSVIGTEDNVLPPSGQLSMSNRAHTQITEVPAGHLSMITQAQAVTKVILQAVEGAS